MSAYNKQIFAKNLLSQMEQHHETQAQIAALLGVSRTTVSEWCKGNKLPRMDKIERLASHWGIPKSGLIENASEWANYVDTDEINTSYDNMTAFKKFVVRDVLILSGYSIDRSLANVFFVNGPKISGILQPEEVISMADEISKYAEFLLIKKLGT